MPCIVLFSDDFRLFDNPHLYNASLEKTEIIPLYIYDEKYCGRKLGEASKVFLHHTLASFSALLNKKYGSGLAIRKGNRLIEIEKIIKETGAKKVFLNRSYTLQERMFEQNLSKICEVKSFKGKVIFEPSEVKKLQVFTYFWKECLKNLHLVRKVLPEPLNVNIKKIPSLKVEDLGLLPNKNWHKNLAKNYEFDYKENYKNIDIFLKEGLKDYRVNRNFPALSATSKLSPYIRFGTVSVNFLFWKSFEVSPFFASELGWREFAFSCAFHSKTNLWEEEIKPEFKKFEFEDSSDFLNKWERGETGEEFIDAGMKELWYTGYMHNRVRMVTASFLIKDLLVSWKKGEEWFWGTLCDACPIVNPFSWQWVFGSGMDSSPFFRIFNPELQAKKFDPNGRYISKWNPDIIKKEKIVLHEEARKKAMEKYSFLKS